MRIAAGGSSARARTITGDEKISFDFNTCQQESKINEPRGSQSALRGSQSSNRVSLLCLGISMSLAMSTVDRSKAKKRSAATRAPAVKTFGMWTQVSTFVRQRNRWCRHAMTDPVSIRSREQPITWTSSSERTSLFKPDRSNRGSPSLLSDCDDRAFLCSVRCSDRIRGSFPHRSCLYVSRKIKCC